ncbi:MAG: HD domain-containing protein [Chitinivibrionales bacterium]|nr:HD domain-containing protein [Chitinivibrionales bacterium]
MVRYKIDDVSDDMILGESIFTSSGELLLAAGYHVTGRYRQRLKSLGFSSVMIEVEGTEGVIPETIISEHVQREMAVAFNKTSSEMKTLFNYKEQTKKTVQKLIKENRNHIDKMIMNSGIVNTLDKFIEEILSQSAVVLNLSALAKAREEYCTHVINVTISALCLGKKYRFSYDEMKQLGMGAINYDLGLAAVSKDILEKEEPLTDEEKNQLQQHTVYGHLMLSQNPSIPPTSAAVAFQHHEYQNGTGYPRGLRGENLPPIKDFSRKNMIHRYAEIVAVADMYDMLSNGRLHYSNKYDTRTAIRRLIEMGGNFLNLDIVKTMIAMVPLYPVGARVHVVNAPISQLVGYYGVVAKDNPDNLEYPQIVLYETKHHQKVKPILIDLAKHKGFAVELAA